MVQDADAVLLERLRAGDEESFVTLVRRHHDVMLRVASSFVPSRQVAEEVVQETWVAVLRGIDAFEGRSSLRTWIFKILVNRARTAGSRERRSLPMGMVGNGGLAEPDAAPTLFDENGGWLSPPEHWPDEADDRFQAEKLAEVIRSAIDDLPERQRRVVTLRDIEGLSGAEVCDILQISAANQRVLLHRARGRLRQVVGTEVGRL
ncbi:MAG TPA: sigma-70 family RNA polymerase sigma factor [Streptosporangiaceae bacterium]|nr:sigma-70 family RNA polymerase sigma factor [Streptosporangiaceae bacterium]